LFSRLLYPGKNPVSIVTCPEELGSGTQIAAHGKFFSLMNQFGESIPKGEFLSENLTPDVYMLPARDDKGHIYDNRAELFELIDRDHDTCKIVNLVFGSKSGIEENLKIAVLMLNY